MEVRITFRSEIILEGHCYRDIRKKWENLVLFSDDAFNAYADVIGIESIEDPETNEDVSKEWVL